MRIAILTSAHSVLDVRIFHKEAVSLSNAGFDITLVGPSNLDAHTRLSEAGISYQPLSLRGSRIGRIRQWVLLSQFLLRSDFKVWHFHDPELLPVTIFLKWLFRKNVKLIYDVHEDYPKDILDKNWIPVWLRKTISLATDIVEGWGIKKCDLIVAATDSIAERASKFSNQVVTVHNYPKNTPTNEIHVRQPGSTVQIIYAGNITPIRGLREVVRAMEFVEDLNVTLNLVGALYPENFEFELHSIAGKNVKIYGKVSFEESQQIMAGCDMGIVTFLPLSNHVEAMPNKFFEYMQKGMPIIVSNFPLWEKIIHEAECGITVDPHKPEEIASAIRKLAINPNLREKMGRSGIRIVQEKYSWLFEEQVLIQAYKRLNND